MGTPIFNTHMGGHGISHQTQLPHIPAVTLLLLSSAIRQARFTGIDVYHIAADTVLPTVLESI